MMRRVVERIGRHLVRLDCAHVVSLFAGEEHAVGRSLWCERCAAPARPEGGEHG